MNSQSPHPIHRTAADLMSVHALSQMITEYDGLYERFRADPTQRKPAIVFTGSKYMKDLDNLKRLTRIPWELFLAHLTKSITGVNHH